MERDARLCSPQHAIEYEKDGVTVFRGLISQSWAAELFLEAKKFLLIPGPLAREHRKSGGHGKFHVNILMHARSKAFNELALRSCAADISKYLLNKNEVYFFYDQLFYKSAQTPVRTQWHQDLPFWPLKGTGIPSIWIALTEVDEETSAVQYIPGSHKWNCFYDPVDPLERDFLRGVNICPEFHLEPHRSDINIRSFQLKPGDAVVHHPLIIHGAGPNLNDTRDRAAVSLRYCSPEVEWDDRPNTMFFPGISGKLSNGTKFADQNKFAKIA